MHKGWMLRGFLVAALIPTASGIALAADWRNHTYPKDGFAIATPTPPKMSVHTAKSPEGKVEIHIYESEYPDADHPYQVFVSKYPAEVDEQEIIKATKHSQVNASKGGAISDEHDLTLDGAPGADYTVTYPQVIFHVRMIVKGDTTYQAIVGWTNGTSAGEVDRFFASFHLKSK